jgi:hypothetical protein
MGVAHMESIQKHLSILDRAAAFPYYLHLGLIGISFVMICVGLGFFSPPDFVFKPDFQGFGHHFAAVFLELALVVLVVEVLLRKHEQLHEARTRQNQLRLIKSAMFRTKLQDLYVADFQALKDPVISLKSIQDAKLPELKKWKVALAERTKDEWSSLCDPKAMERVVEEYIKAEPVWKEFERFALMCNLDYVFHDMITIQHLIADVKACRTVDSEGPEDQKGLASQCYQQHKERIIDVWSKGIRKFIDYAADLQESDLRLNNENAFKVMMNEYLAAEKRFLERKPLEYRKDEQLKRIAGVIAKTLEPELRSPH